MQDDRHFLVRMKEKLEQKCPWIHFALLPVFVVAAFQLIVAASHRWHGVIERLALQLLWLATVTAAGIYGAYAQSIWRASKTPMQLPAKVVGMRREEHRVRYSTYDRCYLSFKPLDGSPYIELRVPETEMNRFCVGETGLLRYRPNEYVSFTRQDF